MGQAHLRHRLLKGLHKQPADDLPLLLRLRDPGQLLWEPLPFWTGPPVFGAWFFSSSAPAHKKEGSCCASMGPKKKVRFVLFVFSALVYYKKRKVWQ